MARGYAINCQSVPYLQALDLQHRVVERKVQGEFPDVLLLLEHPPVITLGRRGKEENIRVSREELERQGVEIHRVERGGDVTYHGPGQLVGYAMVSLLPLGLGVVEFVDRLEEVMIRILADYGVRGCRNPAGRGVWVGRNKIGSVGVAVRRWITSHGFALNINPREEHLEYVIPCGLRGVGMTSISRETGISPRPEELRSLAAYHFGRLVGMKLAPMSHEELEKDLSGHGAPSGM